MLGKMKQMYELQKKARELKKKLELMKVKKTSNGISVQVNGAFKVESISIDPELLSSDRKSFLESNIAHMITQAFMDVQKKSAKESKGLLGDMPFLN